MKIYLLVFILISNFLFINCDSDYYDNLGNPDNINIETISYELTYNNYSVVKVTIKTYDELEGDVSFHAYLKTYVEGKEYKLNCSTTFYDIIECYSKKNESFNLNDKYYFYYNKTDSKITFDENDILEDDKKISLVFKPEISVDDRLYKDNRKITAETDRNMVEGGYIYITKKSKKVLNRPKDGFNKYIELNNYIAQVGLNRDLPLSTLIGYRETIRKGYHIVDAVLRFTSDKVPVICHEEDLEKVSDGEGKISSKTIKELLKLDFGSKFDKKYYHEKILTLEVLLQLCKDYNVIIDLDLSYLNYDKYFAKDEDYANKLLYLIEKYDMYNSVYFTDSTSLDNLLKLKELKKEISISVANINKKEDVDKVKTQFPHSNRIIYTLSHNNLDEELVKYIKSLGQKIKVESVDDKLHAKKMTSSGVDYIKTTNLLPFTIENEKEDPIIVRCSPVDDDRSECDIEDDVYLKDNEFYNIYYSENIYNVSLDINEEPIGEFQYIDTNILDELYYVIDKFNFNLGLIKLNLSHVLKKGESIYGIIGPEFDNVAEYYQFNFTCEGKDNFTVDCLIEKNESKVEFRGNYCIYYLEDYSLNEFETEERGDLDDFDGDDDGNGGEENYVEYIVEKKRPYLLIFCVITVIIICLVILYFCKFRKKNENYNRIRIVDNNYISDNYLFR